MNGSKPRLPLRPLGGLAALFALLGGACADAEAPARAFEPPRSVAGVAPFGAQEAARFGLSSGAAGSNGAAHDPAHAASRGAAALQYELPAGWTEQPPSALRAASFLVGGDSRAECYLTSLAGEAGGLGANVNRWRAQMGQPPLDAAALARLPAAELLGGRAVSVELSGHFTGMDGKSRPEEQRLLGLIHIHPSGSLFLKAVGPRALMDAERQAFFALAASMRPAQGVAQDPRAAPNAQAPLSAGRSPHAAEPLESPESPLGAEPAPALEWRTPDGWERAPNDDMSLASFRPVGAAEARCTLTLLSGNAGGVRANLDRWSRQLGGAALGDEELASLPTLPMLGERAPLLMRRGALGPAPLDDALLLGLVVPLGEQTLFVKFSGPRAIVMTQREAFVALCKSLELRTRG